MADASAAGTEGAPPTPEPPGSEDGAAEADSEPNFVEVDPSGRYGRVRGAGGARGGGGGGHDSC